MTTPTIKAVRGMNDMLPDDSAPWAFVERTVMGMLRQFGYREIRMPIVERTELFVRSIGEVTDIVEKEMYSFTDRLNGEGLTLRPEATASCVRAALEHNLLYNGAQRLFYFGPMFRHERPQRGRYRQFYQIGVEALGFAGPDIDAEVMIMCARIWRTLGISDVSLELNTLGSNEARARYRARLVAYLERYESALDEDSRRRLRSNPLRVLDSKNPNMRSLIEAAPRLLDDLDEPSLEHFEAVQRILRHANLGYSINPRLVRGLDYYNRTVFEFLTTRLGAQAAICAGGRYDGLIAQLGGKPTPACGFAMGVERLIELLVAEAVPIPTDTLDLYIVHSGGETEAFVWTTCDQLRARGLSVILHCGGGSFKSQLRRADTSGARFAVIIGEDEVRANKVGLKPLRIPGGQSLVDVDDVFDLVSRKV
jgi:histidyl-tRNA synthetase